VSRDGRFVAGLNISLKSKPPDKRERMMCYLINTIKWAACFRKNPRHFAGHPSRLTAWCANFGPENAGLRAKTPAFLDFFTFFSTGYCGPTPCWLKAGFLLLSGV
jgi:hypothetical protein